MNKVKIIDLFSEQRSRKYFLRFPDAPNKAIELYKSNILISKSLYPILSIIEIALRNSIHSSLSKYYKTDLWFNHITKIKEFDKLTFDINRAKKTIVRRNEVVNAGKIVAELNFGFWSSLFNSEYENLLWKHLRLSFPNMPKNQRKRAAVSAPVNDIRKLRNRVYHYEPIIWNTNLLKKRIDKCYILLDWLDPELSKFAMELGDIYIEIDKLEAMQY